MPARSEQIERLRTRRRRTRETLSDITAEQITRRAEWQGRRVEVRFLLLRLADMAHERKSAIAHTLSLLDCRQTEAQRILGMAMETRGQLRAILTGFPDDWMDRPPAEDEWSVRQTLDHHWTVEQRYMQQTAYATERAHSQEELPLRMPDERIVVEPLPETARTGGVASVMVPLYELRVELISTLSGIADEDLTAPTPWSQFTVDVRYRLHRFAAHEREHTIQIAKTLAALGHQPTEAQRILGQAELARGAIEGMTIGLSDELAGQSPGSSHPSVNELLEQAVRDEDAVAELVLEAVR